MQQVQPTDSLSHWTAPDGTLSVGALLTICRRRRGVFIRAVCAALVLASVYCIFATRRYRATSQVQVEKEDSGSFGLESTVMGPDGSSSPTDSLDYNITLQTQVSILKSEALALAVVRDMKLETTADYYPQKAASPLSPLLALRFWRKPVEPLIVSLDHAPDRRYVVRKIFDSHLKVVPVTGTRLIDVSYSDPDPERAAAVVNHLVELTADFTFKRRFDSTLRASSWLSGQITDLKHQTQSLEAKAAALQRGTGMFGDDASRNVVLERLDSLNQGLSAAEQNRILKEAIYKVAQGGDPELISSLSGNASIGAAASPVVSSLSLIQNLRQQEAGLRSQLALDSERYGPSYPQVQEREAQLKDVESSIAREVHRLGERARTDYEIATRSETSARAAFEQQKEEASRLNDTVIAYKLAKQEADSSRELYEGLLAKLKQAGVLEGLRSSNITIVSAAQVPPPSRPRSPNVPTILGVALAFGSFSGLAIIGVQEATDDKVRSLEALERSLGAPLLAVLPEAEVQNGRTRVASSTAARKAESNSALAQRKVLAELTSTFVEGLRSLRTALLLSRSGRPPKVILVTSSLGGEGKTTLALNLAALLAHQGNRVLLVDADLRKPSLHQWVEDAGEAVTSEGLASALVADRSPAISYPSTSFPTLGWICGDYLATDPAELLGSPRMKRLVQGWRKSFDFIVLDSAPILPVTDSILLSQLSDATLLIARHGETTKQALRRSLQLLRTPGAAAAPVGVVLNGVAHDSEDFYEYFGFEGGRYAQQPAQA